MTLNIAATLPRSPLIQLCYVRLAVRQPQPAAAFATDVLGLQPVPDKHALLFRSDHRYHTLCLATDAATPSIGIEIADEPSGFKRGDYLLQFLYRGNISLDDIFPSVAAAER